MFRAERGGKARHLPPGKGGVEGEVGKKKNAALTRRPRVRREPQIPGDSCAGVPIELHEHLDRFRIVHGVPGTEQAIGIPGNDTALLSKADEGAEPVLPPHVRETSRGTLGNLRGTVGTLEDDFKELCAVERIPRTECPVAIPLHRAERREEADTGRFLRGKWRIRVLHGAAGKIQRIRGEWLWEPPRKEGYRACRSEHEHEH